MFLPLFIFLVIIGIFVFILAFRKSWSEKPAPGIKRGNAEEVQEDKPDDEVPGEGDKPVK